jgi:hypothetical protein
VRQGICRESRARIAHTHDNAPVLRLRKNVDATAGRSELNGVRQEIRKHLLKSGCVCLQPEGIRRQVDDQLLMALLH